MSDMVAGVAEADGSPVLVDKDGTVWVALDGGEWSYLSEHTQLSWDVRFRLPIEYEPYRALDTAASEFIRHSLVTQKKIDFPGGE